MKMTRLRHRLLLLLAVLAMLAAACGGAGDAGTETAAGGTEPGDATEGGVGQPEGEPIRIGGTLALTGPFAPTAAIHKIAGEQFVDMLNDNGGLLGRPVEWVLLDDESEPDTAAALYERLITEENVDLLMGPYGTANITSAMAVAERYQYAFPHHTASLTYAYTYDWHFPTWFVGLNTHYTTPEKIFSAYQELDDAPQTVGFVVNRFPGTDFLVHGIDDVPEGAAVREGGGAMRVAEDMGMDVVLDVSFDIGTTDFAPIAEQVKEADPDLLYVGALGEDGPNLLASLAQINWKPRHHFYQWPAPGAMLAAGDLAQGATSVTIFEPFEPYLSHEGAQEFVERYRAAAEEEGFAYTTPETQAGASWAAWQVLTAGVEGCECLEHEQIAQHLLDNPVQTVQGEFDFRPEEQNYGDDIQSIKQIQGDDWYPVWPEELAAGERTIQGAED